MVGVFHGTRTAARQTERGNGKSGDDMGAEEIGFAAAA